VRRQHGVQLIARLLLGIKLHEGMGDRPHVLSLALAAIRPEGVEIPLSLVNVGFLGQLAESLHHVRRDFLVFAVTADEFARTAFALRTVVVNAEAFTEACLLALRAL